ncbi:bifunctional diguanylate cyclase/phosphohydrolase [Catellatospora tritici]|uniref:bifunctional diguanylate cyclase/phosphohydrolase n=1 Tax=Catellatospora tritici TaxID=2851566 RepID=UPI001C2DDA20|nr:diguanylate cyclase [Catellatospora tritici]MBV1851217.1 diguanylate cyclase [Catellatospora tritici]
MTTGEEASTTQSRIKAIDGVELGAALAGAAWLVLYGVLLAATRNSPNGSRFVGEVLYLVPIAAAAALSVVAARRTRQRVRTAWRLLVASNSLWLLGESIWAFYTYTTPGGAPVPSIADAVYLASYACALPAIVIGLGLVLVGRAQGLVDALLVAAGAAAIGWQLVIGPLLPSDWNAATLVTFIYPVLSVSIVSILVAVLLSGSKSIPASMILVGAAFGVSAVTDAAYAYITVVREYASSSWVNLGWQGEAVLLCLAAVVAARRSEADKPGVIDPDITLLPAVVAVLAVGGLAAADLILVGRLSEVTLAVSVLLLLGLLVRQVVAARDRTRLTQQLRTAAVTDQLTGLHNRRFFQEMIGLEAERAARRRTPLSLVLVDLDHFKAVNDTFGHSVGDAVLIDIAQRLRRACRASDLICRYGGEEFVCLLPGTDAAGAAELAERMRATVGGAPVLVRGGDCIDLTASIGVATAEPGTDGQVDIDALVNAADMAVYQAKDLGRDRVVASAWHPRPAVDADLQLPAALVWMSDRIDRALGDGSPGAAVSRWARLTAERLGLDEAAQRNTAAAARVRDLGRILDLAAPPATRPDPEADGRDAQCAARLLVELADRPDLAQLVAAHREWYDGSGAPTGCAGAAIPIEARIIAVCDAWARAPADVSGGFDAAESRRRLLRDRGIRFDPVVVDAFLSLVDEGVIGLAPMPGPVAGLDGTPKP